MAAAAYSNGNPLSDEASHYTYNEADWLLDISGTSYTWDANGNLLDDEVKYLHL